MIRWLKRLLLTAIALAAFVAAPLVMPAPLFAYGLKHGNLSVHSDRPIHHDQAKEILAKVQTHLNRLPGLLDNKPMQIYSTHAKWRHDWIWVLPANWAAGFVAVPFTRRHAFIAGADFSTNELIKPEGNRPFPPRTLVYYSTHELTHVATYQKVGWFRFVAMPEWVREGVADYVAMPPEKAEILYQKIGRQKSNSAITTAHGYYAPYRLLVAYFLENKNWTIEQLMASDLTFQQARSIVFKELDS